MLKKEIKEKLIKIGYKGKTDLESLLGVLPSQIKTEGQYVDFAMNQHGIWYENRCTCDSSENCPVNAYFYTRTLENETLTDTAGRLIISLHKKNILNSNNINNNVFNTQTIKYIIVINPEASEDFFVTFPDFPEFRQAGYSLDDAKKNAQDVLEWAINGIIETIMYEPNDDDVELPEPKTIEWVKEKYPNQLYFYMTLEKKCPNNYYNNPKISEIC
jgi:predicted RNase H-like HicB family nuclease